MADTSVSLQIHYLRRAQILDARSLRQLNFVVSPHIGGCSVCSMLNVTLLAPRILDMLLDFWKICAPLQYLTSQQSTGISC